MTPLGVSTTWKHWVSPDGNSAHRWGTTFEDATAGIVPTTSITAIIAPAVNNTMMRLISATSLCAGWDSSAPPLCSYTLTMAGVGRQAHDPYAPFIPSHENNLR